MDPVPVKEGKINFDYPAAGKPLQTWYKILGDLTPGSRPLVIVHGGPGAAHNYLKPMQEMARLTGKPVVFYDQMGCGNSTHLSEYNGNESFWKVELFVLELQNLLKQLGIENDFNMFGHSWGGMLVASFAITKPKGLHKLIISNSPATAADWEKASAIFKAQLPQHLQDTLDKHEAAGTIDSKEYEDAVQIFMEKHYNRVVPMPPEEIETLELIKADPTVYRTMNGPNEFCLIGSLRPFDLRGQLHAVQVPTLIMNGQYDAAQDFAMQPYFDEISKVKWVTFEGASHSPLYERRERYFEVILQFLQD